MAAFSVALGTAADCGECARLLIDQLREHGIETSPDALARVLEVAITDMGRSFLMLARDGDRVVGVAYVATILSAEHCGLVAWLEELYVAPDCRHRGIGAALVTAVLERAKETDIVAVDLEIDAGHERVISLYQRLGFRRLERSRWVREFTQ
jgi:ribosomal protein S18 acetylase RimI-like enzyme